MIDASAHNPPKRAPAWGMFLAVNLNRFRWLVILFSIVLTVVSLQAISTIKVSTKLESLMPEGAKSVETLNKAMIKAGSFASIQVILRARGQAPVPPSIAEEISAKLKTFDWVDTIQTFEDLSSLERHKLLLLDKTKLEALEQDLEQEIVNQVAQGISEKSGIPINITLHATGISGKSKHGEEKAKPSLKERLADFDALPARKDFVSDDGLAQAIVIWPRSGNEGLDNAKNMIEDVALVLNELSLQSSPAVRVGIAGRIRNKVAQFDAVINDVVVGLGASIALILLTIGICFRSPTAIVVIIIPLFTGILWTLGLTTLTVGGLNLITIFLGLILFGLGIDFGIHNFSRYKEARINGHPHIEALAQVIGCTGTASFIAALTTAAGFFALLFTEFRAFREFGIIAGSGIIIIFIAMYSLFPAILSVIAPLVRFKDKVHDKRPRRLFGVGYAQPFFWGALTLAVFFGYQMTNLSFEKNFKNIQAERSDDHKWATAQSKNIFKGGHDRAILLVDSIDEVQSIETYFEEYIAQDTETPTISKITSVRNFLPSSDQQKSRLEVIERMRLRLSEVGVPEELEDKAQYLDVDQLDLEELPGGLRRAYLGDENIPGYLMYLFNSVTMDDADLAKQFYDDVASFTVNGKTYYPASEGFIFVEMLALMKADAVKAIALVLSVTVLILFLLSRSVRGTLIMVSLPILSLIFATGLMALFDVKLSIINMVILPSIIGISVDNAIHLYERLCENPARITISELMATTGAATSITTLTTLLGFAGLMLASMGGLRTMGYVAVFGFLSCLLLTWTLMPFLFLKHQQSLIDRNDYDT